MKFLHIDFVPQTAPQAKGGCYICRTPGKCYNLQSRLRILVEAAIVRWCEKLGSKKADHQIPNYQVPIFFVLPNYLVSIEKQRNIIQALYGRRSDILGQT